MNQQEKTNEQREAEAEELYLQDYIAMTMEVPGQTLQERINVLLESYRELLAVS